MEINNTRELVRCLDQAQSKRWYMRGSPSRRQHQASLVPWVFLLTSPESSLLAPWGAVAAEVVMAAVVAVLVAVVAAAVPPWSAAAATPVAAALWWQLPWLWLPWLWRWERLLPAEELLQEAVLLLGGWPTSGKMLQGTSSLLCLDLQTFWTFSSSGSPKYQACNLIERTWLEVRSTKFKFMVCQSNLTWTSHLSLPESYSLPYSSAKE